MAWKGRRNGRGRRRGRTGYLLDSYRRPDEFYSFRIDESTEEAEYGLGDDNIPTIFDFHIFDTEINRLVDEDEYTNPSTELTDAVTGITLFWAGPKTLTANGGSYPVLLWVPEEYDSGSSIAHLDEYAYPPGAPNALMTPSLSHGEAEASLRGGTPGAGHARRHGLDNAGSDAPGSTFWGSAAG